MDWLSSSSDLKCHQNLLTLNETEKQSRGFEKVEVWDSQMMKEYCVVTAGEDVRPYYFF